MIISSLNGGLKSPLVKISLSNSRGAGSFPCGEAKIPHASQPKKQNINNKSNIITNSIKTLEMVPIQKKKILKKEKKTEWEACINRVLVHMYHHKSHQGNLAGCTVRALAYLDV